MTDLKISQFADGGDIQVNDEIATNRSGVNTKVAVGSAAALDAGSAIGDVVVFDDVSGSPAYPSADGSQIFNLPDPDLEASDIEYIPSSGSSITSTDVQGAIDELENDLDGKLSNITGLITNGANVTITGAGTSVSPYQIAATVSSATAASAVTYNGATSGLSATELQTATDLLTKSQYYMHLQDTRGSGTGGGNSTAGATAARTINTVVHNNIPGASRSGNQVTLPAGKYKNLAWAQAYATNDAKLRIYNTTTASYILEGQPGQPATATQVSIVLSGPFTLAGTSVLELRQYTQSTSTNGLGNPVSQGAEIHMNWYITPEVL